jgi:hypothetical protein
MHALLIQSAWLLQRAYGPCLCAHTWVDAWVFDTPEVSSIQAPDLQSVSTSHFLPMSQILPDARHLDPPQSTSVSSLFLILSLQEMHVPNFKVRFEKSHTLLSQSSSFQHVFVSSHLLFSPVQTPPQFLSVSSVSCHSSSEQIVSAVCPAGNALFWHAFEPSFAAILAWTSSGISAQLPVWQSVSAVHL